MTTEKKYSHIFNTIKSVVESESNLVANLANVTAILKAELGHHWIGFYTVDTVANQLVLGPFQGPLACTRIPYGKGVCGDSWKENRTIMVADVHQYPGHIACSSLSNSEIVVPIVKSGKVVAVLDIDSTSFGSFSESDKQGLESICELLASLF